MVDAHSDVVWPSIRGSRVHRGQNGRGLLSAFGCAALIVALGACGSSTKASSTPQSGTGTTRAVSVSSATGSSTAGDKAKFCADNAAVSKAATPDGGQPTPRSVLSALRAEQATIADFRANAPGDVVGDAQTLADAARLAISADDASGLLDSHFFAHASIRIDAYCGQNGNGTSASSTEPEFCEDTSLISYAAALINGGSPTPANTLAVVKDKRTLVDALGRTAPADIRAAATTIVAAAHKALAENNGAALMNPDVLAAIQHAQGYCNQDSDGTQTGNGPL